VQTARNLVGVGIEFAARMQDGHHDLGRRTPLFWMDFHRNAAAVVHHADRAIIMDGDFDMVAIARQGFVDRVVDHLENHMMQTRAVIRVADVHAGTFADRLKPFQDFDAAGIVGFIHGGSQDPCGE
jgi:hypothetical protein